MSGEMLHLTAQRVIADLDSSFMRTSMNDKTISTKTDSPKQYALEKRYNSILKNIKRSSQLLLGTSHEGLYSDIHERTRNAAFNFAQGVSEDAEELPSDIKYLVSTINDGVDRHTLLFDKDEATGTVPFGAKRMQTVLDLSLFERFKRGEFVNPEGEDAIYGNYKDRVSAIPLDSSRMHVHRAGVAADTLATLLPIAPESIKQRIITELIPKFARSLPIGAGIIQVEYGQLYHYNVKNDRKIRFHGEYSLAESILRTVLSICPESLKKVLLNYTRADDNPYEIIALAMLEDYKDNRGCSPHVVNLDAGCYT